MKKILTVTVLIFLLLLTACGVDKCKICGTTENLYSLFADSWICEDCMFKPSK